MLTTERRIATEEGMKSCEPRALMTGAFKLETGQIAAMEELALDLTLLTGRKVAFCVIRDNDCALMGDFGSFRIS